jgi:tetratricopeptide (TPR) repeat protein
MTVEAPPFLDVDSLLEHSQPRHGPNLLWYAGGAFILIVLVSAYLSNASSSMAALVNNISSLAMLGIVVAMGVATWQLAKRARSEQQQLAAIEELMQLRRWPDAAMLIQSILSRPTRTPQARIQGLLYLATILSRYHRFEDAIHVQNELIEHVTFDPGTAHALRLARAMAMLHEDHLFDADRAISELRRQDPERQSAGLALVEIYRDVKTGHPAEAIEMFEALRPAMQQQLGNRVADAYALIARAYDLQGKDAEAQDSLTRATLLAPAPELARRYSEFAKLLEKYKPASAPAEAA